ncbi:hypothetical protein GCM10023184_47060 [Flaviaesturariibacter amylovorans]|uniref:RHS repeat-associated core domain-containing protein n=2 Tax=Flaviaesturariibacter amylovorans TaxID=1084520 RepID=A0ABP8HVA7_9BACT
MEQAIRSYAENGRLVREETSNPYESNLNRFYKHVFVYDLHGRQVYEQHIEKMSILQCFKYIYNDRGQVIKRTGFGSGDSGGTVRYFYKGDSLIRTVREPGR